MRPWIALTLSLLSCLPCCLALPDREDLWKPQPGPLAASTDAEAFPLRIWVPYVGQGDATLLQFPNGATMLIDAGPPGAGRSHLLPLLQELDIRSLDALVLTHYDLDHLGGVPELPPGLDGEKNTSDDIKILSVYDRGGEPWDSSPGYAKYLGTLDEWRIPRRTLEAGERLAMDPNIEIQCVAVNGTVSDGVNRIDVDLRPPTYAGRENAASIALLIEHGGFRYLTAGDLTGGGMADGFLTPDIETPLAGLVGKVDALHANHHGSLSSSNENFIKLASPQMIFIQSGQNNGYGHPSPDILQSWLAQGTEIYSTHEGETFLLESTGNELAVRTRPPDGV